jgi:hypothetical protein
MVVAIPLLLLYVLNLTRSLRAGVDDPLKMLLAISTTGIVLTATLAMFCVGRWFDIADKLGDNAKSNQSLETTVATLKHDVAHLITQGQATGDTLARILQAQGAHVVPDTSAVWAHLCWRMLSYNPLLRGETKGNNRIGYTVDTERLENFVQRMTTRQMVLGYVFFLPRGASLGLHVEPLVRLCTMVKAVHEEAEKTGRAVVVTPRIFLVDGPRPSSSFFVTARAQGGTIRPVALEYFRSYEPGVVDTPTADRMLIEHANAAEIEHLTYLYDDKLKTSHEVAWGNVEEIIAPMLGGWTAADADKAIRRLYEAAAGAEEETIVNADHFVINPVQPSIRAAAPVAKPLAAETEVIPVAPAPAKGGWPKALSAGLRSFASRFGGRDAQPPH